MTDDNLTSTQDFPLSIPSIMEEDLQQFSSMFHSYFEFKNEKFHQLDQFIAEHRKTIDSYLKYMKEKNKLDFSKYSKSQLFDFKEFNEMQKSHITDLKELDNPEASQLLDYKEQFYTGIKDILKKAA